MRVLRDYCTNGLDCPKIYELDDGRRAVRGDKPDAPTLTGIGPLPDHENVVVVPNALLPAVHQVLTLRELGEFVKDHHTHDLFRLETLSYYSTESDADDFHRYMRGEPAPTADAKNPWLDRVRADVTAGRDWRRMRALSEPLSDYLRYECEWGYVPLAEAGEEIRITRLTDALAKMGDFFVLDGEHVVRSRYDDSGRFLHAEVIPDPADAALYIAISQMLWILSSDFDSWWATHPHYHRDGKAA